MRDITYLHACRELRERSVGVDVMAVLCPHRIVVLGNVRTSQERVG